MDFKALVLQLQFLIIFCTSIAHGFVGQEEKKCKYLRIDKLLKIRCYDMNLKEVPQHLKSSVEVLDLSYNRIKKLKYTSFQQYKNLKFLLLYENMIQSVEPGTFEHLTSLEEIDLSNNALMTIPLEIFQLPSLRNLYVDSNELINLQKDLEALETPIRAPLEYINIADCGLNDLPNLGVLPKLWHVNASSNPLTQLSFNKFAFICNLKSIDLTKTLLNDCTCQQLDQYFRNIGIKTTYVPICKELNANSMCRLQYNETLYNFEFDECLKTKTYAESRNIWYLAAGSITAVLIILLLVYYCIKYRRRDNKKSKNCQNRNQFAISPKCHQQDNELLHSDFT